MMSAAGILKLIETVSPDDDMGLDAIDIRVFCYLAKYTLDTLNHEYGEFTVKEREGHFSIDDSCSDEKIHYSRSRDALKAIRPEGWSFSISKAIDRESFRSDANRLIANNDIASLVFIGRTEELAELHAIIQAIEYERTQK
ncbi:MAG: hypothetical protein JWO78_311 [Micavibrio sp.]|nr:hypothetical protein [Micavibrio sp.]